MNVAHRQVADLGCRAVTDAVGGLIDMVKYQFTEIHAQAPGIRGSEHNVAGAGVNQESHLLAVDRAIDMVAAAFVLGENHFVRAGADRIAGHQISNAA